MAEELPKLPFFFRIYSPNGQGIVYRADRANGDSYMCTGSRQIGNAGGIIWEVGGYADAMPRSAMHTIMRSKPMTKAQTTAFVNQNSLGAKYKTMSLYSDGHGYWFAEGRSRSSSPKTPRSPKSPKNSKGKGKSKKNQNRNRNSKNSKSKRK